MGSLVTLAVGYSGRMIYVQEGVGEVRDLVNEGLNDECMVDLHRLQDEALVSVDPMVVQLIEPWVDSPSQPFFQNLVENSVAHDV